MSDKDESTSKEIRFTIPTSWANDLDILCEYQGEKRWRFLKRNVKKLINDNRQIIDSLKDSED